MGLPAEDLYDSVLFFCCYDKGRPDVVPEVVRRMYVEVGVSVYWHVKVQSMPKSVSYHSMLLMLVHVAYKASCPTGMPRNTLIVIVVLHNTCCSSKDRKHTWECLVYLHYSGTVTYVFPFGILETKKANTGQYQNVQ